MVASGTAASQAIAMAFSPFITRLYGPEAYGIQGVFMSIASVMAIIAAMTYPTAIVLPKSDADALGLARLSIYIGIAMSVLVSVVLFFFGSEVLAILNAEAISIFTYFIPVFMFISVMDVVVSQWLIRKKTFSLTAKVLIWQTLFISTIKTGLGFIHPTAAILIVTNTLNGLLGVIMMLMGLRKTRIGTQTEPDIAISVSSMWALAKQHRDFPFFRTPQVFLNAVSRSLPVVMLSTYFGPTAVGFYAIASTVLGMPTNLIGSSVMQVFYPRINEAIHRGEDAKALIIKATIGLALSGVLPFAIIIFAGPILFTFVFGSEWRMAGVYAQWLSIWLFFQYINRPAVSATLVLGLQKGLLIYELFSIGTKALALYLGYVIFKSDVVAIALFSIFGVVAYVWLIFWCIVQSGKLTVRVQQLSSEINYKSKALLYEKA